MSKHLTVVNNESEINEAQKNLEEPFVILNKENNLIIYQDDSHCDAVLLIDDWNNYRTEIPVIQRDISWIKGRRCLVKKTNDGVAICYLDENNSELFHDGKTEAKLDGSMGQWMTDLPEFNIQCTCGDSDWVKLHISRDKSIGHKSRRVLLGVTKAISRNNTLWSCKYPLGLTNALNNTTYSNISMFNAYATALGKGFGIIDYESYCKIAYMFMAKYKTKDPRSIKLFGQGIGNAIDGRLVGVTSVLGNVDGHTENNHINIFGVENWYGVGDSEFLGGITISNTPETGEIIYIYDGCEKDKIPTVPYRTINKNYISYCLGGYISRMEWGDYADLLPTEFSGSNKYFYSDFSTDVRNGWSHIARNNYLGLFGLLHYLSTDTAIYNTTSRLQYRGNITVIDDPQEFIKLPVGF